MKNCTDCVHAEWVRTKNGRLHPSGDGKCTYPYKIPELPQAFYWLGMGPPQPCGGSINRNEKLKDYCMYYSPTI